MTFCSTTFLVVALLSMGCAMSALWLPFVIVAPHGGTPESPPTPAPTPPTPAPTPLTAAPTPTNATEYMTSFALVNERRFQEQFLSNLPQGSFQCPYFNNPCWFGDTPLANDTDTDELIRSIGCDSLGKPIEVTSTRFWGIGAATLSVATVVAGFVHVCKGGKFGSSAAFHKFGAFAVAAAQVALTAVAVGVEAPIAACVQNSIVSKVRSVAQDDGAAYTVTMLSLVMSSAAASLQCLNAMGMLLSWWLPCCGTPSGRSDSRGDEDVISHLSGPLRTNADEESLYGGVYGAYGVSAQNHNHATSTNGMYSS